MVQITFNAAYAQIDTTDTLLQLRLQKLLTYIDSSVDYQNKMTYARHSNPEVCLLSNDNRFYTGLLGRVVGFLQSQKVEFDLVNTIPEVNPTEGSIIPDWAYNHQKSIVDTALSYKRGVIQSPTGSGSLKMLYNMN